MVVVSRTNHLNHSPHHVGIYSSKLDPDHMNCF